MKFKKSQIKFKYTKKFKKNKNNPKNYIKTILKI